MKDFSIEDLSSNGDIDLTIDCRVGDKKIHIVVAFDENRKVIEMRGKVYDGQRLILDCDGQPESVFEEIIQIVE